MICTYCKIEAAPAPIPRMQQLGYSIYFCHSCQSEYIYLKDSDTLWIHSIYTTINERMYRWSYTSNAKQAILWYVAEPGIPGVKVNEGVQVIKTFMDNIPSITPDNINNKIRTWLPFL